MQTHCNSLFLHFSKCFSLSYVSSVVKKMSEWPMPYPYTDAKELLEDYFDQLPGDGGVAINEMPGDSLRVVNNVRTSTRVISLFEL